MMEWGSMHQGDPSGVESQKNPIHSTNLLAASGKTSVIPKAERKGVIEQSFQDSTRLHM